MYEIMKDGSGNHVVFQKDSDGKSIAIATFYSRGYFSGKSLAEFFIKQLEERNNLLKMKLT